VLDDTLVHFECMNPAHRAAAASGCWGGLAVNEGRWSYCDGLGVGEDHVWAPTGGVPYGSLLREKAEVGMSSDATGPMKVKLPV